jgi:hypothetical protein
MKPSLFLRIASCSLLMFLLASCASKIQPLREDTQSLELSLSQGFLVLAVDTDVSLTELHIQGSRNLIFTRDDLRAGTNYLIAPVAAGQYRLSRIYYMKSGYMSFYLDLPIEDRAYWSFEVFPGTMTYVGHLEIVNRGYRYDNSMVLLNNSSIALEFLEEKFPSLLSRYDIRYGGVGDDDFFQLVRPAKEGH